MDMYRACPWQAIAISGRSSLASAIADTKHWWWGCGCGAVSGAGVRVVGVVVLVTADGLAYDW